MTLKWPTLDMKISTRLRLGFAVLLGLMLIINFIALRQMRELYDLQDHASKDKASVNAPTANYLDRVLLAQSGIALLNENARRTMTVFISQIQKQPNNADTQYLLKESKETSSQITGIYEEFQRTIDTDAERALFKDVLAAREDYLKTRSDLIKLSATESPGHLVRELDQTLFPKLNTYLQSWDDMISLERHLSQQQHTEIEDRYKLAKHTLIVLLIIAAIFSVSIAYSVMHHITGSISKLNHAARSIAYGNLTETIVVNGHDELSDLARTFNKMAIALETHQNELIEHQKNLEHKVQVRTAEISKTNVELSQTNAKLAQAHIQILQSEKLAAVGQLAAGVAHEINNPIAYVYSNVGVMADYFDKLFHLLKLYEAVESLLPASANVELISKVKQDMDYVQSDAKDIIQETKEGLLKVTNIVTNLKNFSQIDTPEFWCFNDLYQGIASTLSVLGLEQQANLKIVREFSPLPLVECVLSEINQVFLSLLQNAVYATEGKQGQITVRTSANENTVRIEIIDNGSGISAEHLDRVFDPFFTTKPVGKGTGLGLTVAYNIIKKHHGSLSVTSEPDKGSNFCIILPVNQANVAINDRAALRETG